MNNDLVSYYNKRAREYEKIYCKPERQNDLEILALYLRDIFSGKDILEIACGTGYWTERIALSARSIHATDINDAVIEIAKSKQYPKANVSFQLANLYELEREKIYDGLFGGFIWSHIPIQNLSAFIDVMISHVVKGGNLVFIDNKFVESSNLPINKTDDYGNTYQARMLEDGSSYTVLKNFPSKEKMKILFAEKKISFSFQELEYYYVLVYQHV